MGVIFILGFFLDFIEIAVVVVPIVAPILLADPEANITAVWLGVMIGLNIQTSFLTPPFGFALFYLRGVAPAIVKTVQMYKGVIAFILLQIAALGIVGYYPSLVNYLPNRVSYLSETAPPPRAPQLQHCLDGYVADRIANDGGATLAAISAAEGLDLSVLPEKMAGELGDAFENARTALGALDEIGTTSAAVEAAADDYRPVLREVRSIQKDVRELEAEIADLKTTIGRITDPEAADRKAALEARMAELEVERDAVAGTIPETWDDTYGTFSALVGAEDKARLTYRRAADGAYEAPAEVSAILADNAAFAALAADIDGFRTTAETADGPTGEEATKALEDIIGDVEGARAVKSAFGDVRKAFRGDNPDRDKIMDAYEEAVQVYRDEAAWRDAAAPLKSGLDTYLAEITPGFGARQQEQMTREQALYIAGCNADHRDISLNF